LEWLSDGFTLYVIRDSHQGQLRSFSVVLMYEGVCISRYDTAHGYAHRDVLGLKKGWMKAVPCAEGMSYNRSFDVAMHDLKENYEEYHRFFLQN
jgi:hypothetical protein